jgi:hypothetical protein
MPLQQTTQPQAIAAPAAGAGADDNEPVIRKEVVSRPGARVVETVYVLSPGATKRLQTSGRIPSRAGSGQL